ncbi:MAG: hypothetical protein HQK49_15430 [Oligoflexia bacterium]|nr:hypothetical protein [Oligoflexia bacterium]
MKSIFDTIISFGLLVVFTVGVNKFYHALEKELVIKLSKGLTPLTTITRKMTKTKYDWK